MNSYPLPSPRDDLPGEKEALAKAMREQNNPDRAAGKKRDFLFESDFKAKHGITFVSDPPDRFVFEYGGDGEVIWRNMQPGGSGGDGERIARPKKSLLDEEQEAEHPFAIKVKVLSKGLDGDWSTARVQVVSGSYRTDGGSAYNANGVEYPSLAYNPMTPEEKATYRGSIYLFIPLIADNTNGVPAANVPNKVRAIAGGVIKPLAGSIPVWPVVSRTTLFPGVAVAATAVHIGSWGVSRVNVSTGVPTYEIRLSITQKVSDDIVLGGDGRDAVSLMTSHAFQPTFASGGIVISYGHINTVPASGADGSTVWGVGSAYVYWVKVTTNSEGIATAAVVERGAALPADSETVGYQALFEVDATGRVTSQHVTNSLGHRRCAGSHLFWGFRA